MNKRKRFLANKLHRQLFFLLVLASIVPAGIVGVCLYYFIFGVIAEQIGIPEAIAYNIIPAAQKVTTVLAFATPVSILFILLLSHNITHKIIGPFDRIVKELDECVKGNHKGPIAIRKSDKFRPLVERINKLLKP